MTDNMTTETVETIETKSTIIETETGITDLVAEDTVLSLSSFERLRAKAAEIEEAQTLVSITPKYKEFQPNETVRGIYVGLKFLNKSNGERIKAVQWIDASGNAWINSGMILVGTLEGLPAGTPMEITFIGTKQTGNGRKVNDFDVKLLTVIEETVTPF